MGQEIKKGTRGPNSNYITRTKATRKLQISLNDFRRLCILKGIVPREPPSRKKANHGNSAPTSFYHIKDINFLAHEPIIQKLRAHKIFLRRVHRALGKQEWTQAKQLEENRPTYKLDHIIKERYPTFIDAVRDLDDALCSIFLAASLPQHRRIPQADLEDCARIAAEWQLYVMHTRSLRKVFLSIKGIYYQAEVMGETITWIVPYQFTQQIPMDVDFRVMRTFLELYKSVLGFVFYKLYTDVGLLYPPPLDVKKDEGGGGVDAYRVQPIEHSLLPSSTSAPPTTTAPKRIALDDGKTLTNTDVQAAIESLGGNMPDTTEPRAIATAAAINDDSLPTTEEFVLQLSTHSTEDKAQTTVMTLRQLASLPSSAASRGIFAPYTIFISRESPRHILEFVIRCFGGRVGWPETVGSGSPFNEMDESITHVIIDRPVIEGRNLTEVERRRKYVQPQWIVDCINAGKILLEEAYGQGKVLPPHLSPFNAEGEGAYDPTAPIAGIAEILAEEEAQENDDEDDEMEDDADTSTKKTKRIRHKKTKIALLKAADDAEAIRKAELEAERSGVEPAVFDEAVEQAERASKKAARTEPAAAAGQEGASEENMSKMLLSNKKRKLYGHIKGVVARRNTEKSVLEQKKISLVKQKRKESKKSTTS